MRTWPIADLRLARTLGHLTVAWKGIWIRKWSTGSHLRHHAELDESGEYGNNATNCSCGLDSVQVSWKGLDWVLSMHS